MSSPPARIIVTHLPAGKCMFASGEDMQHGLQTLSEGAFVVPQKLGCGLEERVRVMDFVTYLVEQLWLFSHPVS